MKIGLIYNFLTLWRLKKTFVFSVHSSIIYHMNQDALISHEQDEAKRYNKIARKISIVEFVLGIGLLLVFLFGELSREIRDLALNYTSSSWVLILLYLLVIGIVFQIISLPLSIYGGFVLEHRFKLSTQRFSKWLWDHLKEIILSFILTLILVEVLYFLLRQFPMGWWFAAAVIFTLFFVLLGKLAPIIILPLFYKFQPLEDAELKKRLLDIAEKTKTKVIGVFRWGLREKTRKANAALLGSGKTRRIILSDTLLDNFSSDEIETVLAHELGHHNLKHIRKAMVGRTIISFLGWYLVAKVLSHSWNYFGLKGMDDVAGFPLIVLVFTIFSLMFLPWINLFSRTQEKKADEFAIEITQKPDAFISMLRKLTQLNLAEYQPNKIITFIFNSHPSPAKRIEFAQGFLK